MRVDCARRWRRRPSGHQHNVARAALAAGRALAELEQKVKSRAEKVEAKSS